MPIVDSGAKIAFSESIDGSSLGSLLEGLAEVFSTAGLQRETITAGYRFLVASPQAHTPALVAYLDVYIKSHTSTYHGTHQYVALQMRNLTGSVVANPGLLFPAEGATYQAIVSQVQWFVGRLGYSMVWPTSGGGAGGGSGFTFACGGIPFLLECAESRVSAPTEIWWQSTDLDWVNGAAPPGGMALNNFRNSSRTHLGGSVCISGTPLLGYLNTPCLMTLECPQQGFAAPRARWWVGKGELSPVKPVYIRPYIGWPTAVNPSRPILRGILWDSFLMTAPDPSIDADYDIIDDAEIPGGIERPYRVWTWDRYSARPPAGDATDANGSIGDRNWYGSLLLVKSRTPADSGGAFGYSY